MSNLYNLFGEMAESNRGQPMNSIIRSKTYHDIKLNKGAMKSKGLSIRSSSDMNISHSPHSISVKKNLHGNKEQDCLKMKLIQIDNNGYPISPSKKISAKKLIAQTSKSKEFALTENIMINKTTKAQKTLDNDVFKKPLFPKKNIKKFPESEKLSYFCDDQHEFDCGYIDDIDKEFKELLSKRKENIKPYKEKMFISDSKTPILPEIPKIVLDTSLNEDILSPTLPEISDISDDDF